tara:strand:- start:1228 stop:2844 length:1617 start_codon:yes stop_codon:yes gene_type:complete
MSDNNKARQRGIKFREWILSLFKNPAAQDYLENKYGITPEVLPQYGMWDANMEDWGWSFNLGPDGFLSSVVISGVEIPIKELPGYEEGFKQPLGGTGFWGGVFNLPAEWAEYDVEALPEGTVNVLPEAYGPAETPGAEFYGEATGEIQEEMDAEEAADPDFQALKEGAVEEEEKEPSFFTREDFEKNTLSEEEWNTYLANIKAGSTPQEAWAYATNGDPAKFNYVWTWDEEAKRNKPAYYYDPEISESPIPIPVAAQPSEHINKNLFMSGLHNMSPDEIEWVKDFLIMGGVVDEGDFAGHGFVDRSLELIVGNMIDMANMNYGHIAHKSDDYYKLIESGKGLFGDNPPAIFEDSKWFEWGLFSVVASQYGMTMDKAAEVKAKEIAEDTLAANALPSKESMARAINDLVKEEIGVDATPEQVREYTDYWIASQTEWGRQIEYANKVAEVGMDIEHYHIKTGRTMTMEEVQAMRDDIGAGGDVLEGIVGQREKVPTVTDPWTATYNLVVGDLAGEKEIIEAGRKKRAKQSGILQAMAGKF